MPIGCESSGLDGNGAIKDSRQQNQIDAYPFCCDNSDHGIPDNAPDAMISASKGDRSNSQHHSVETFGFMSFVSLPG